MRVRARHQAPAHGASGTREGQQGRGWTRVGGSWLSRSMRDRPKSMLWRRLAGSLAAMLPALPHGRLSQTFALSHQQWACQLGSERLGKTQGVLFGDYAAF